FYTVCYIYFTHAVSVILPLLILVMSFYYPASTDTYTLSLHDALPISHSVERPVILLAVQKEFFPPDYLGIARHLLDLAPLDQIIDRKSTRLNSSHVSISYAVFCLKKKIRIQSVNLLVYYIIQVLISCL